jgi:hypothetical protein
MKILFLHGWQSVPGGVKPTLPGPPPPRRHREQIAAAMNLVISRQTLLAVTHDLSGGLLVQKIKDEMGSDVTEGERQMGL